MRRRIPRLFSGGGAVRLLTAILMGALLGVGVPRPGPADAQTPAGYRVESLRALAPGVEYRRLVTDDGPVVAHVVRMQHGPGAQHRTILSNGRVDGSAQSSERTSDMCRRVGCIAAVNGDFYQPATGEPVGGVAHGGRILRSPVTNHDQLTVSAAGALAAGPVAWSGRLHLSGLGDVNIDAVNRPGTGNGVALFTPDHGDATPPNSSATEIVLRILELPLPLGPGHTGLVEMVTFHESAGGTPIPRDGAVLSGLGEGARTLSNLWRRSESNLLGTTALFQYGMSPAMHESIGGSPILLRGGQVTVVDDGSSLVAGRHPRTIVGWNGTYSYLVAVDGRQPGYSAGLTLFEAADLLAGIGATEAINLDGGGSTTLVVNGVVVNRPSDQLVLRNGRQRVVTQPRSGDAVVGPVERPVGNALAVVGAPELPLLVELAGPPLVKPLAAVPVAGPVNDPASRP